MSVIELLPILIKHLILPSYFLFKAIKICQ
nr:MAG TPA: hypothetical protein [Crassvirales sp.]